MKVVLVNTEVGMEPRRELRVGYETACGAREKITGNFKLAGAVSIHYRFWRLQENLQVEEGRTVAGIAQIQPHHVIEFHAAATIHLPEPGDSRPGFEQTAAMPRGIHFHLIRQRRTRSDQRHFSAQHIDQLRQFVEAGAP